jgi:hypothetical protein
MKHELTTTIEIEATSDEVWAVLTDLKEYPTWNPFIVSASGSVVVGQRLINRMQPPGGKAMTFKPTVTEVVASQTFEWLGRLGLPGLFDGRHRFELKTTASGGTLLRHSEKFSGLLVRAFRSSLEKQTKAGFKAMNVALKQRVEGSVKGASTNGG